MALHDDPSHDVPSHDHVTRSEHPTHTDTGGYPAWEFGRMLLAFGLCALVVIAFVLYERCG